MNKWHNGPNGPGICKAKKGNCPFGGSESHFSSKEEAEDIYNKEQEERHGLLPGMKSNLNRSKSETRIFASSARGYKESLSSHVSHRFGNMVERSKYIKDILNQDKSSKEIAEDLNRSEMVSGVWSVSEEKGDETRFKALDYYGNEAFLVIKRNQEIKKPKPRGHALAYNENETATSLSNYVYSMNKSSAERVEYIKNVISEEVDDPKGLVDRMNKDSKMLDRWELSEDNDDNFVIKGTDRLGNRDYIKVSK